MEPAIIRLAEVSKTVPSGAGQLTILHPTTFDVRRGEVMAIVGPSGSGKSTMLGLIAGLDAPTTGTVTIEGTEISSLGEDALAALRGRHIGFVFQSFHLIPALTAIENVALPLEIAGVRGAMKRARALLADVGLAEREDHYPAQLSGGEQQRVAIARAFANHPSILLADEPTGNLDSATGRQIIDLLIALNTTEGTTLVLVTHDRDLASLAGRQIELADGRIVADHSTSVTPVTVDAGQPVSEMP
ncbi:MAG TPA: ABC transporter ATP-binding protein [Blastocatellia bacterium]|nr:ABC transporter ATP-binding protein [Blastocatellia bacterium]